MEPNNNFGIDEISLELMQILPENYSYDQALKLIYEYYSSLFINRDINEEDVKYFYEKNCEILDTLFNVLVNFKEFEKFAIFNSITFDAKNEDIKYSYKQIKDEMSEFETKMYVICESFNDDEEEYLFNIFLLFFKEYFLKTNKNKLSIYKNSFIENCKKNEKDMIEKLEDGFERYFKTTLLEDKSFNNFSC